MPRHERCSTGLTWCKQLIAAHHRATAEEPLAEMDFAKWDQSDPA